MKRCFDTPSSIIETNERTLLSYSSTAANISQHGCGSSYIVFYYLCTSPLSYERLYMEQTAMCYRTRVADKTLKYFARVSMDYLDQILGFVEF